MLPSPRLRICMSVLMVAMTPVACQPAPSGVMTRGGKAAPKKAVASVEPQIPGETNPLPVPTATAATIASVTLAPLLRAPATASRPLSGRVMVDAPLALREGGLFLLEQGSQVISHNGGTVVAAGAGNVLSHNGGAIVAAGGGNVISHNGGMLLGGTALMVGGASFDAAQGGITLDGQMVAYAAGNVIAPGGAGLAATASGLLQPAGGQVAGYRLTQTMGSPTASPVTDAPMPTVTPPPIGAETAAVGMRVSVVSLATGQYLPLGVDADGNPVYAVYSNVRGEFVVYLPNDVMGGVAVVAAPPDDPEPRLSYNTLVTKMETVKSRAEGEVTVQVDEANRSLRAWCEKGRRCAWSMA